ncbi:LPS export ABC transporter periplasmic protein LptC [Acinetobacter stercoris]|uniref:Lipopolysaccharide-assembly, LptC-related n=1 Tax=Acinetobacter stercoris TaxID=2126983 RepID=A0A2U3N164_9GAMM|nr:MULTISPECIES: LPS export ABC transporter periplasmic protein LptC [Acinetobacter]SPL71411.1 Lipopolysaccharide-assembly, LptC-related [Acinetobacter stercoris]
MDTKSLYIIAVVIAAISGGIYYYSGKGKKLDVQSAQNMTYSAENIHLTQTNEKGDLHVRADVDHLEQDLKNKSTNLRNLNASMYKNDQVDSTFFAKIAQGYNDNEKVVLSDQVEATKLGQNGKMVLTTDELTAYPQDRKLETSHQVNVTSPDSEFVSQGLKADLNEGQYEFFNIRGKYAPR